MDVTRLRERFIDLIVSLYREVFLDDQFEQLQKLQADISPSFVAEMASLFYEDSEKLLKKLSTALEQPVVDFQRVDAYVHQFKGSSSSIGARRVKNRCVEFRKFCEDKNLNRCLNYLQVLKDEYYLVKNKLETLISLEQQILLAGGKIPLISPIDV